MYLLGISAFYHDSAAAILRDGVIIAAAQEERFTRKKHDDSFPSKAISYCLKEAEIHLEDLSAVVYYDKPFLTFERLLETYYDFAPSGFRSFLASMPTWVKQKLLLEKGIKDELKKIDKDYPKSLRLLFPEHHLSHAASAFYPSPFQEAAILTVDGVGEWTTASISHGAGNQIKMFKELRFPHSVGLLYTAFTYFLGFRVNSGEYKLMGLAPYGNPASPDVLKFIDLIKTHLADIKEDGSLFLDQSYFDYATGLKMIRTGKWEKLFGLPIRKPESEITQPYCDLALAIQRVTEEIILKMAAEAKRLTESGNICLAGGVALNCVANGKLLKEGLFENVWVQPAPGDAGGAIGAAYSAFYIYFNQKREEAGRRDAMQGSFLGPSFTNEEIESVAKKHGATYSFFRDNSDLTRSIAGVLAGGNVVGWFQGRMEWGPRALGNRSILADPRSPEMQKRLNQKIKYREGFRPFAPCVRREDVQEYFELNTDSPYMLFVSGVQNTRRKTLPENYLKDNWRQKLYFQRSDLPAITHVDYSARVQTVEPSTNARLWQLLGDFKALTGYSVLINTSFNVRGEPIVCTPEDAFRCFMKTKIDYLVMGNYVFEKTKQYREPGSLIRETVKEDLMSLEKT